MDIWHGTCRELWRNLYKDLKSLKRIGSLKIFLSFSNIFLQFFPSFLPNSSNISPFYLLRLALQFFPKSIQTSFQADLALVTSSLKIKLK